MADSAERYNSVLEIIDERLIPDATAKQARGEVFTPLNLVREILFGIRKSAIDKGNTEIWGIDKEGNFFDDNEDDRVGGIPLSIWRDPDTKMLDPANGIGNFPVVAFYMLDYQLGKHGPKELRGNENKLKRRNHIVEKMLYMIELDKGNVNTARKIFNKISPGATPNIICANTLEITDERLNTVFKGVNRFDVVMGNPPFNSGHRHDEGKEKIWPYFIDKSKYLLPGGIHILKKGGILLFVLPQTWRNKSNPILERIKEYELHIMKNLVSQSFYDYPMDYIHVLNKPYTGITLKISNDTFLDEIDIRKVIVLSNGNDNILNKVFNIKGNKLNVQGVNSFNSTHEGRVI
jgi:hypothetical protein